MLFCFIWLDLMVKHWVSHSFYFIPTKVNTGTPEQRCDRGGSKRVEGMETCTSNTVDLKNNRGNYRKPFWISWVRK